MLADRANDTVLHQLYMTLESACISNPTRLASTIHAVDGEWHYRSYIIHSKVLIVRTGTSQFRTDADNILTEPAYSITAAVVHTWSILCAQYRLHRFRALYADLQDTPSELLQERSPLTLETLPVLVTLFLSLFCFVQRCVHLKRMDSGNDAVKRFFVEKSHGVFFCNYILGTLFICTHLCLIQVLGLVCLYGHRVATSIAILTIFELWKDISLEHSLLRLQ